MVRVKSRYLLCEVNVSDRSRLLLLDDRAVAAAVKAAVARIHGDYGAALLSIRFSVKVADPWAKIMKRGGKSVNIWENCDPGMKPVESNEKRESSGKSGRVVKYLNAHTGIVLLRFPKKSYKLLWSALPFITCIETRGQEIPCFLNCLHVGGTIRTCQKFLIRYNTQQLQRMLPKCKDEEEKKQVQEAILNCYLTGGNKEAFEDELESEDDEEE